MGKYEFKNIPGYSSKNFEKNLEAESGNNGDNGNKINIPRPTDIEERFHQSIIGQKEAVKNFATLKKVLESGVDPGKGPKHVEWLSGPSGVGKTEMVKKFIEMMLEDHSQYDEDGGVIKKAKASDKMIRIDGGSYQKEEDIAKVLGAPPGYVGAEIEPILSQKNIERNSIYYTDANGKEKKICVILIDEADKAHQALYRTLLSALDDGVLTLGKNEKVDFSNCVFFFTSNLGNQEVLDAKRNGDQRTPEQIYLEAYKEHFPPEFLGRVRKMTTFEHLSREEIKMIVSLRLNEIRGAFAASGINFNLDITPDATEWLADRGYSRSEGVRAMQKLMNDTIQEPLALISGEYILEGKNVIVSVSSDGDELEFSSPEGDPEQKPKPEKPPRSKPKPRRKPPQPNPEPYENIPNQESDNDKENKFLFYRNLVNDYVKETINSNNFLKINEKCDALLNVYRWQGFNDQQGSEKIKYHLRSAYDFERLKDIKTVNDLILYLDMIIKKESGN